jgi:hypothetical protein
MAKRKERIMAFDTLQPDTLHNANERICRNFICSESKVGECLRSEDRNENWKQDPARVREFDSLTGYQTEARGGLGNIGQNLVSLVPVALEKDVKPSTPYIYKAISYGSSSSPVIYGSRKDIIQFIQKKIKTRNVVMHYDGKTEKGELDIEHINSLFNILEPDTIDFDIVSLGRNDTEGDAVLVTIYKNLLKV